MILQRLFLGLLLALLTPLATAGIFDDPENLKVLPEDISPGELRNTMREFALGTGLRCSGCHVGEEGQPIDTYDFPDDEKQKKKTARIMIKMVRDINARITKELDDDTAQLVKVECVTCHRGQNRPQMLDDLLAIVVAEDGLDKSLDKYRELRGTYYGTHTFDFGEMTLIGLAENLARNEKTDAALRFLDLNLEFSPDSWFSLVTQGKILAATGDKDAARAKVQKALEMDPENRFIQGTLKELE